MGTNGIKSKNNEEMSFIKYIADESHYKEVLTLVEKARRTVWIGTADIKDLYVDDKPFLALIASLLKKGVEVRLIHAKEPGTVWREDHEKHPILYDGMERVLCPRVHFKLIIIDSTIANLVCLVLIVQLKIAWLKLQILFSS